MGMIENFMLHGIPPLYRYNFYDGSIIVAESPEDAFDLRMKIGDKYWQMPDQYMGMYKKDPDHQKALQSKGIRFLIPPFETEKVFKIKNYALKAYAPKAEAITPYKRTGPPITREETKQHRNDKCSCGSGKKYKNCCMKV
jgi:uncharacterized protein YecA (UPF0149 family)